MKRSLILLAIAGSMVLPSAAGAAKKQSNTSSASSKASVSAAPVQTIKIPAVNSYRIPEKYRAQTVSFSGHKSGTIVIDPKNYFLYYVLNGSQARRYGIAVGKQGLEFVGKATIEFKREWPRWIPTKEMVQRSPAHYGRFAAGMDGGPGNPLGARALYLYQGKKDTYIRIHGTVQPWTIGSSASNGCFRMTNEDVLDLYSRVPVGTEVEVL